MFELFQPNNLETTLRIPLHWLGVLVHYRKPGKPGELIFGGVDDPCATLYGTNLASFGYRSTQAVRVPRSDEPLFRAYFTEVAALAGRPVI